MQNDDLGDVFHIASEQWEVDDDHNNDNNNEPSLYVPNSASTSPQGKYPLKTSRFLLFELNPHKA